jgi:hypothetical protein
MLRCTTLLFACAIALPAVTAAQSSIPWNAIGHGDTPQSAFAAMYQNARQNCGNQPAVVHNFETLLAGRHGSGFVTYGDTSCAPGQDRDPIVVGPGRPGLIGP